MEKWLKWGWNRRDRFSWLCQNPWLHLWRANFFCRWNERFPKINLRLLDLSVKDSRQLIETREVDFGLLPNAPALEGVNIFPLIAQDLYLIGLRRKLVSHSNFVSFKDLHCYPLVMGE